MRTKNTDKTSCILYRRGEYTMKVKYGERGTFDPEKAARGLIELTNKIKKQDIKDKKENEKAS
jgi:hypothetical protein